jgi:hypothetical protein
MVPPRRTNNVTTRWQSSWRLVGDLTLECYLFVLLFPCRGRGFGDLNTTSSEGSLSVGPQPSVSSFLINLELLPLNSQELTVYYMLQGQSFPELGASKLCFCPTAKVNTSSVS